MDEAMLTRWRGWLGAERGGAGRVAREAAALRWPPCPRCRRLGDVVWDVEAGAPRAAPCEICGGSLCLVEPATRDYLAAHAPWWWWRREAWLRRLEEALGLEALRPGEARWVRVTPARVLQVRAGDMGEIEVTLDSRGLERGLVRDPDGVLQWWPARRAAWAVAPTPEALAWQAAWLEELDDATWGLLGADAEASQARWRP